MCLVKLQIVIYRFLLNTNAAFQIISARPSTERDLAINSTSLQIASAPDPFHVLSALTAGRHPSHRRGRSSRYRCIDDVISG